MSIIRFLFLILLVALLQPIQSRGAQLAQITTDDSIWVEPTVQMEFVRVPGRCFEMGSPLSENERGLNEGPVHEVCVDGFSVGRFEVTNAQYRIFKPEHDSGDFKGQSLNGDNQPVVHVSWEEATAYAKWLTEQAGKSFRLPTEAEWEYVARAGSETAHNWGDDVDQLCLNANVNDQTSKEANNFSWANHNCNDGYAVTSPVGKFTPNNFGLYDIIGNVWEWNQDWHDKNYYSQSPKKNPQGPTEGRYRVGRGGAWDEAPETARSAERCGFVPREGNKNLGFRLVAEN